MSFSTPAPTTAPLPADVLPLSDATVREWRVHRLREAPQFAPLVALVYAVAFVLWRLLFPNPLALFIPVFALTGALAEYLFPVTYRLTRKGAHKKCWTTQLFIAWADVKRAGRGTDGIFLSPLVRPSRLDDFRGIRLRFGCENPDEVCQTVRQLWHGVVGSPAANAQAPQTKDAPHE